MRRMLLSFMGAAILAVLLAGCATSSGPQHAASLFDGKSLAGWKGYAKGGGAWEKTWAVRDGVIVCSGEPMGYIYTSESYQNFIFTAEYRWPGQPGNSGFFCRINGELLPLPRGIECQLKHGNAGDLFGFQGLPLVQSDGGTNRFRHVKSELGGELHAVSRITWAEKPPGEWNKVELMVRGEDVLVKFNGKVVNHAKSSEVLAGHVGLQSEGGQVEFRNIRIQRLR